MDRMSPVCHLSSVRLKPTIGLGTDFDNARGFDQFVDHLQHRKRCNAEDELSDGPPLKDSKSIPQEGHKIDSEYKSNCIHEESNRVFEYLMGKEVALISFKEVQHTIKFESGKRSTADQFQYEHMQLVDIRHADSAAVLTVCPEYHVNVEEAPLSDFAAVQTSRMISVPIYEAVRRALPEQMFGLENSLEVRGVEAHSISNESNGSALVGWRKAPDHSASSVRCIIPDYRGGTVEIELKRNNETVILDVTANDPQVIIHLEQELPRIVDRIELERDAHFDGAAAGWEQGSKSSQQSNAPLEPSAEGNDLCSPENDAPSVLAQQCSEIWHIEICRLIKYSAISCYL